MKNISMVKAKSKYTKKGITYGKAAVQIKKVSGVTIKKRVFTSSKKKVATVSKKGKVTAKKAGSAKIK